MAAGRGRVRRVDAEVRADGHVVGAARRPPERPGQAPLRRRPDDGGNAAREGRLVRPPVRADPLARHERGRERPGRPQRHHARGRTGPERTRTDRPRPAGLLRRLRALHRRPHLPRARGLAGGGRRGGDARQGRVRGLGRPLRPARLAERGRAAARGVCARQRLQSAGARRRRRRRRARKRAARRRGPLHDAAPGSRLPRALRRTRERRRGRRRHRAHAATGAVRDPRAADEDPRSAARRRSASSRRRSAAASAASSKSQSRA